MHVALCTDGIFPHALGGMQRHSRLLAEHLARSGAVRLTVLHPHTVPVFDPALGIDEVRVAPIDAERFYLRELWSYSGRVAAELDRLRPDVILSQGFCVWKGMDRFSDRLIVHPHGLEMFQGLTWKERLLGWPFRQLVRYVARRSSVVISLGGRLTVILEGLVRGTAARVVVVPNAVEVVRGGNGQFSISNAQFSSAEEQGFGGKAQDTRDKTQDPSHKSQEPSSRAQEEGGGGTESGRKGGSRTTTLLFVGRFTANKGLDVLLSVAERLVKEGRGGDVRFQLAGDGPLRQMLVDQPLPNVELLGRVDDDRLQELYTACDALVLPTRFEGMPTVVLEAMAHAKPIIVSDVGATAELVDEANGYLLPPGDADALFEAIHAFDQLDDVERVRLGRASLDRTRFRFIWPIVVPAFLDLFDEVSKRVAAH